MFRLVPIICMAFSGGESPVQAGNKEFDTIVFGSCARQDRPAPVWESMAAIKPQLAILLGDNIYGDTQDMEVMKAKYGMLADSPGFKSLRMACELMAVWDDHDYGVNDGGGGYPQKEASRKVMLDFFGEPKNSLRRSQPGGIYTAKIFGPPGRRVQVILLDTRYQRSELKKAPGRGATGYLPDPSPSAVMLSPEQWDWLGEQLAQPAELRLIGSSIQVVSEEHRFEKWANMPLERAKLFAAIRKAGAGGVVILSGDRHLGEISSMDAGIGYPLIDITASGINQASPTYRQVEANRHRVAGMPWGNHFGAVRVDWSKSDPLVRLELRDEAGDVVVSHRLPLSALNPKATRNLPTVEPEIIKLAEGEVSPETAKGMVGKKVTVRFRVASSGKAKDGSRLFLNSNKDFRSPDNFAVVLDLKKLAEGLKAKGLGDLQNEIEGKVIRVTGTVSVFRENPQVVVESVGEFDVVR